MILNSILIIYMCGIVPYMYYVYDDLENASSVLKKYKEKFDEMELLYGTKNAMFFTRTALFIFCLTCGLFWFIMIFINLYFWISLKLFRYRFVKRLKRIAKEHNLILIQNSDGTFSMKEKTENNGSRDI